MSDGKRERPVSRRDFLRIFPGLMGRKVDEVKKSIPERMRRTRSRTSKPSGPVDLPAVGRTVDGIPLLHPWIGAAWAIAARHRRPRSLPFLLGATGEAFGFYYSREDPDGAAAHSPGNTFLLALALAGLSGRAAPGGPFEPALGGLEVAIGKGLTAVIAAGDDPAVVVSVDREKREATWVRPGVEAAEIAFDDLADAWREGRWPGGRGAFLRVTVEEGPERASKEVLGPALPAALELLHREKAGPFAAGPAAWTALAEDLRAGALGGAEEVVLDRLLPRVAVARRAAGDFLESAARLIDGEKAKAALAAARVFREIHAPSIEGEVFGTGLLPEAAECLRTNGKADPAKLDDPALRKRAADLLLEIRDLEAGIPAW